MSRLKKFLYDCLCPVIGRIQIHNNKYINVIYYHDIVHDDGFSLMRTNIDVFKRQMTWLANHGYKTIRFDELNDKNIQFNKKTVLISFDDGWRSNYTEIFVFMKTLGIKYNIFLTIGEIDNNPDYLTWDMVRAMHRSGICGFGAHTFTHPDMSDLSKIDFDREIHLANKIFKEELGYEPKDFCYPFGYYSEESNESIIANTCYDRIYTSKIMFSYLQDSRIVMGRNGISTDDTAATFRNKVKGYNNGFYSLRRKLLGE